MRRRRRPAGGMINVGVAFALLVLIGLTALSASSSPPPAIAEISPQANKQITQAPSQQTSRFGGSPTGDGQPGGATTTTSTTAAPRSPLAPPVATSVAPATHQCVGDPPRQTEDPQSPPCVAYWSGDNGGATSKGVTRDSITIFVPNYQTSDTFPILQAYFDHRFEFYGRKLVLINGQSLKMGEPDTDEAAATQVDTQDHAFASGAGNISDFYFYVDLARRGIISVPIEQTFGDAQMEQLHDVYQYVTGADHVLANLGAWGCARLNGQPASHAGGALQGKPRQFGVLFMKDWPDNEVTSAPLDGQLAQCGVKPKVERDFTFSGGTAGGAIGGTVSPQDATSAIVAMQRAGVTSVFCGCETYNLGTMMKAASAQGYYPEWLVSTYIDLDETLSDHELVNQPDQMAHMFGISDNPRQVSAASTPVLEAVHEEDPSYSSSPNNYLAAMLAYRVLMVLASGIQMAGPHLTPQTFEQGLARAQFPNPLTPIFAGAAGFNVPGAGHSMTKDFAEWWWSNGATDSYGEPGGSLCYVDRGRRHAIGSWPNGGDPFFAGACDSGTSV